MTAFIRRWLRLTDWTSIGSTEQTRCALTSAISLRPGLSRRAIEPNFNFGTAMPSSLIAKLNLPAIETALRPKTCRHTSGVLYTLVTVQTNDDSQDVLRFAQQQAAEAADLRLKVVFLERRLLQLERRLLTIQKSWTWRLGRVVLFPVTVLRILKRRTGSGA